MSIIYSLATLQTWIEAIAEHIQAPAHLLPTYGRSEDFARPHLEVNAAGMHFVVVERGQELERRTTQDLDELLYWVFEGVTFTMAGTYEVAHRVPGQDFRRLLFQHQLLLLGHLSAQWSERQQRHLLAILGDHPFSDD
ncbi:Imm63 family immunity protein [Hymenobacter cavernae]|uniref:Immunity protein 63 domain-containing protein n=1 Tax=Hymenobacter cavernae TaxID=2044852 RepID=A0ABQ1TJ38_9BACT|nr:Imm63 family immunity protein [Hymenobacter cavernae]GGE95268.1 hypothetical protein GCM10011383_02440 [Hymenobacter cavernae]